MASWRSRCDAIRALSHGLRTPLGAVQHFADLADAKGSRLVRALLKHKEITGVFLGRDFITVNKKEETHWTVRAALEGRRVSQCLHIATSF